VKIHGIIRRRLLVNFRVDPRAIAPLLPPRFAPKLHEGQAVAGICLIRLEEIRPKRFPRVVGFSTSDGDRLDGLALRTHEWKVEPLAVDRVYSSFFESLPATFDCALLMRDIAHEWEPVP
jgi:hypothetical protein